MTSWRFRRQSCRGIDDVRVTLEIVNGPSAITIDESAMSNLDPSYVERVNEMILEGIKSALEAAPHSEPGYRVRVTGFEDLTGTTAPYAFRECAFGATNVALGLEERNPFSGVFTVT